METTGLDILVVDDNALDRELVRRLLPAEHRVCEAATARDAEACLDGNPVDLVLLDYRLPDSDGVDLLPLFSALDLPVVMLTEIETPELIVTAMQRGAQDYLVKSALTRESLHRAILNAVEKAALRRTLEQQQRALAEQASTLEVRNREIRALASALTLAEQVERRRIADLLHDHVQQLLLGAKLHLQMTSSARPEEAGDLIEQASRILQEAIEATRNLAAEVTPPMLGREGLEGGLRWIADHMSRLYHFSVQVEAEASTKLLSPDLRALLLQLVREFVFNAVKHAGVEQATVRLTTEDGAVMITVEDQGCGFALDELQQRRGFGIYSAYERVNLLGGRLEVASEVGRGTRVRIVVPVGEPVPDVEPF